MDEYFWNRVTKTDTCWLWVGSIKWNGYGDIRYKAGHKVAHHYLVGAAPPGLDWDHVCHDQDATCKGGITCLHRRCVNPDHLELVTRGINLARGRHDYIAQGAFNRRKTHCPQGHEYSTENTRVKPNGWRDCRECKRVSERNRRKRIIARPVTAG